MWGYTSQYKMVKLVTKGKQPIIHLMAKFDQQTQTYLNTRAQEGRLYDDATVRHLPRLPSQHPLAGEWAMRRLSAKRLLQYIRATLTGLRDLSEFVRILDLGCGNGWLTRQLAELPGAQVIGVDINAVELAQARRVFGRQPGLNFCYADILTSPFPPRSFDLITIVAALQYFPHLPQLFDSLRALLTHDGEIHILDTPLYNEATQAQAAERSRQHYQSVGQPQMSEFYHHHTWADVQSYHPIILYRPQPLWAKLYRRLGWRYAPFPWLMIK